MAKLVHAAFRSPDGTSYSSGQVHDLNTLPEHVDQDTVESGFILDDGSFVTREEATEQQHTDHLIQSQELNLDKAEKVDNREFKLLVKQWLRQRMRKMMAKAEPQDIDFFGQEYKLPENMHIIAASMAGIDLQLTPEFQAGKFMAKGKHVDAETQRHAMALYEGDLVAAALHAYGIEINEANRDALSSVIFVQAKQGYGNLNKSEIDIAASAHRDVEPGVAETKDTAEAVRRAFSKKQVEKVNLKGKHSKGTAIAVDPKTKKHYLIKPGSGPLSPALGINEEGANQSRREVAFAKIGIAWGLGHFLPDADLLLVDGEEVAAMELLPPEFHNIGKAKDKASAVLARYVETGDLFKWAALDWILGNADRHSGNLMLNDSGDIKLIDHGSTFTGDGFDPADDLKSYIPYYLRAFANQDFRVMTPEQRLQMLPQPNPQTRETVNAWIKGLSAVETESIMLRYGIVQPATVQRLTTIQDAQDPVEVLLALWSGLI